MSSGRAIVPKCVILAFFVLSYSGIYSQNHLNLEAQISASKTTICKGETVTLSLEYIYQNGGTYFLWTEDLRYKLVDCHYQCEVEKPISPLVDGAGVVSVDIQREGCGPAHSKIIIKVQPTETTVYTISWDARHLYEKGTIPPCITDEEVYTRTYTGSIVIKVAEQTPPTVTPARLVVNQNNFDATIHGKGVFQSDLRQLSWYRQNCNSWDSTGPLYLGYNYQTGTYNSEMDLNISNGILGKHYWAARQVDNGCYSLQSIPVEVLIKPCGDPYGSSCRGPEINFVESNACTPFAESQPDHHFYDLEKTVCKGANCDLEAYWNAYKSDLTNQVIVQTDQAGILGRFGGVNLSQFLFPQGTYNRPIPSECETIKLPRPYSWAVNLGRNSSDIRIRLISTLIALQGPGIVSNFDPVFVRTNEFTKCITNYTLPGHIFYPGKVTRCLKKECDEIKILTFGEGVSDKPGAIGELFGKINDVWGESMFRNVDERAARNLQAIFQNRTEKAFPLERITGNASSVSDFTDRLWEISAMKLKYDDNDTLFGIYEQGDTINFWKMNAVRCVFNTDGTYSGVSVLGDSITGSWSYDGNLNQLTIDSGSSVVSWDAAQFTLQGRTPVFDDTTLTTAGYLLSFREVSTVAIWKGTQSTDWNNPNNWSTGKVPDRFTDIEISEETSFTPVLNAAAKCRSLTIKNGKTVVLNNNLEIMGRKITQ